MNDSSTAARLISEGIVFTKLKDVPADTVVQVNNRFVQSYAPWPNRLWL